MNKFFLLFAAMSFFSMATAVATPALACGTCKPCQEAAMKKDCKCKDKKTCKKKMKEKKKDCKVCKDSERKSAAKKRMDIFFNE